MQQPDIIFIVLDTQRADRLGLYGYRSTESKASLTPNLDKFAAGGATYDRGIAPAQWTIPSHASMFTGLYPTAHQVYQSDRSLGPDRPHLAEVLKEAGYQTYGFCNNPLVGILNNGFKRGFGTFYNYGGAFPSMPDHSTPLPWPFNKVLERYTQFLRQISYPIQNFFARSDLAFRLSLNSWATPLWSRIANFKGQNPRSVRDVVHFLGQRERRDGGRPMFLFLNLMETHLPFWPPGEYVDKVAPYLLKSREARGIMRRWNREAFRWSAPLTEPLPELEGRVLSDMYDAEVAYQDDYLGPLFEALRGRDKADNTLTVIVSDHGDGLGEHGYFGHAFVAYQELVRVPLIMHWPDRIRSGLRVHSPVSTRRLYHTFLDAAGTLPETKVNLDPAEIHGLTLMETIAGRDPERGTAFAEIYPPLNYARAIESWRPGLLEERRCLKLRRTAVRDNLKLIEVGGWPDELFDLDADPVEKLNLVPERQADTVVLSQEITAMVRTAEIQRDALTSGKRLDVEADESLVQRLRALGYIE